MRQRVPESTIEWLVSVNTADLAIPKNLALDLLDSRARVKELEEALSEISFYSDDENARKRAERVLRGEER
jgi:hypothetical protein